MNPFTFAFESNTKAMLNSVSWGLFFICLTVLTGTYYFVSVLVFYHNDILHWWKSRNNSSSPVTASSKDNKHSLMGAINESSSAQQVVSSERHSRPDADTDQLIGSVSDLLQEIKTLIQLTVENSWDKEKSQALFKALLARYPQLTPTSHHMSISLFIVEQAIDEFPFELTLEEVLDWWR